MLFLLFFMNVVVRASDRGMHSEALCSHLLVSPAQWRDALAVLAERAREARPEAIIFMGSRAHKLWRGGFDLDYSLIGANRDDRRDTSEAAREAYRKTHDLRLDELWAFADVSLAEMFARELLISRDRSARVLRVALKVWDRCARANAHLEAKFDPSLDLRRRFREQDRLLSRRFDVASELANPDLALRHWESFQFEGSSAWSPLIRTYENRAVFLGAFSGIASANLAGRRSFHTAACPILVFPRAREHIGRLRALGYTVYEAEQIL